MDRLAEALKDRYTLQRELGRGGMATVYLAEDLKHERRVALKVLKPELAAVLGPERFLREVRIAAQLTHPHILPLYDSGTADGVLYYVMPYVEGESLRDRLDREKQLPVDDALPRPALGPDPRRSTVPGAAGEVRESAAGAVILKHAGNDGTIATRDNGSATLSVTPSERVTGPAARPPPTDPPRPRARGAPTRP